MAEEKTREKKVFAVIRVRGSIGVRADIGATLKQMRLTRKNHCVLLDDSASVRGMLQKTHNYITWGEASPEVIGLLKNKYGEEKVFRLNPPRGGFGSIKRAFPKGSLGYRGEKINDLINSML